MAINSFAAVFIVRMILRATSRCKLAVRDGYAPMWRRSRPPAPRRAASASANRSSPSAVPERVQARRLPVPQRVVAVKSQAATGLQTLPADTDLGAVIWVMMAKPSRYRFGACLRLNTEVLGFVVRNIVWSVQRGVRPLLETAERHSLGS